MVLILILLMFRSSTGLDVSLEFRSKSTENRIESKNCHPGDSRNTLGAEESSPPSKSTTFLMQRFLQGTNASTTGTDQYETTTCYYYLPTYYELPLQDALLPRCRVRLVPNCFSVGSRSVFDRDPSATSSWTGDPKIDEIDTRTNPIIKWNYTWNMN